MNKGISMFDLRGKTAVLSGGAGLYGRQIASALAECGAKLYIASRNLEKNQKLADELNSLGCDVHAKELDLSSEKSIIALAESVFEECGKADILINNAVMRTMQGYDDTAEAFDMSMKINATGLFLISRAFGDRMAEKGGGNIINIGSYMGLLGPDYSLYDGTDMNTRGCPPDYFFHKGGITNYTRFLASHYGKSGVRCNCLELGGLYSGQDEIFVKKYSEKTMLGRMANETDIKGSVVFLASDASAYITGSIICVDGGYSAK